MAETITIVVNRPAPFWLPTLANHDPENPKAAHEICGKLLLSPGANTIPLARWKLTADHPAVKLYLELGILKAGVSDKERAERTHTPSVTTGIADLTVLKATPYINASEDADQLASWRAKDERAGIHKLIDARLVELEAEAELDEYEDLGEDSELED